MTDTDDRWNAEAERLLPGDFLPGGLTRASMAKIKRAMVDALRAAYEAGKAADRSERMAATVERGTKP